MISSLFVACLAVTGALAGPEGRLVKPMRPLSDEMIDYVNSVQKDWKAGRFERFAKLPTASLKGMMGAKLDMPVDMPVMSYDESNDEIPDSFDARSNWPNCPSLRDVRDQGGCGSCWAVAAAAAMSDRLCINKKTIANVSAEDLLTCCDFCGNGCMGGYPFAAWEFFEGKGLVTGGLYGSNSGCVPYAIKPCEHHIPGPRGPCEETTHTPACKKQCRPGYDKTYHEDKLHGGKPYYMRTVADIQRDIMTHGPVEAAFTVYADFPTYKSGVYTHVTGTMLGGHAVKMVGWGVENGVDYWLIANSWNNDWGANGYFKIKRGTNECGIEGGVVAARP